MNKWSDFYQAGLAKENEFGDLLIEKNGGSYVHASSRDDMWNHIDLFYTKDDKTYSFDVKSMKKSNRKDATPDDQIHWVELQNVRGNPGWIYGKADFIAFELINSWLIVNRKIIIEWIDKKVIDKTISKSKDFYTWYQRWGRNDILVKVKTSDLREIANFILTKN